MLTHLVLRNFKLFNDVEIELGERVVFVGPNNAGKTSALQALALWHAGVLRWLEKRGSAPVPKERSGVTLNRRDLIALPIPTANLLWRDLHVREGLRDGGKQKTRNVLIDIEVRGVDAGVTWVCALEFDYANEESLYCRTKASADGQRSGVPPATGELDLAFLPPMSGIASSELKLERGAIDVRIGEGRTAEVLRNLCWVVLEKSGTEWQGLVDKMAELFKVRLHEPRYIKERGEIQMTFETPTGVELDISASGRGQQQTLLLLAHLAARPGAVLLLDEPDAHLEILRQRQIYQVLTDAAAESRSQLICASHSEVILNEAADRDVVVAFIGKPHRIDDRGAQLVKALKEIGFEHYLQAEQVGWILYLEGSTDLAILRAFARTCDHAAAALLERPFVHYVANNPPGARSHFHGLREACPTLVGLALYDRLERGLPQDALLEQAMWRRKEIESYLCRREVLLRYAERLGAQQHGELFAANATRAMSDAIDEIAAALKALGRPDPWGPDLKVTDDFLDPLFKTFFERMKLPNLMRKTDYHVLADLVLPEEMDPEVRDVLGQIEAVAARAASRSGSSHP